jgi:8-hydroxy-5-deazaflavin:NADPH oxidoreductase
MRVVFSYARSKEKLMKLARDAHGSARAGTPSEAAKEADALLLAVHWSRIEEVLKQAGDLSGKVIVSCSLPMNADNTELVVAHTSSGVETLAKMVPKARVVSAFNTVPSEVLFGVYEARRKAGRPSLVYCGDERSCKALAPCSRAGTSAFPFRVEIENIARCPCSFVRVQGGAPMTNRPAALFASEAPPRAKPTN